MPRLFRKGNTNYDKQLGRQIVKNPDYELAWMLSS